jgi:hypothetical protein
MRPQLPQLLSNASALFFSDSGGVQQRRHLPEDLINLIKNIPIYRKKFPNQEMQQNFSFI